MLFTAFKAWPLKQLYLGVVCVWEGFIILYIPAKPSYLLSSPGGGGGGNLLTDVNGPKTPSHERHLQLIIEIAIVLWPEENSPHLCWTI